MTKCRAVTVNIKQFPIKCVSKKFYISSIDHWMQDANTSVRRTCTVLHAQEAYMLFPSTIVLRSTMALCEYLVKESPSARALRIDILVYIMYIFKCILYAWVCPTHGHSSIHFFNQKSIGIEPYRINCSRNVLYCIQCVPRTAYVMRVQELARF